MSSPLLLRGVDTAGPGQVVQGLPHTRAHPGARRVRLQKIKMVYLN